MPRSESLAALIAGVRAAADSNDLSSVFDADLTEHANRLARLDGAAGDLEILHWLGWFRWYRHHAAGGADGPDHSAAVNFFMRYLLLGGAFDPPEPLFAQVLGVAVSAVFEQFAQVMGSRDGDDVRRVLLLLRNLRRRIGDDHPDRAAILANMSLLLTLRSSMEDSLDGLNEAIDLARESLDITAPDDPQRYKRQSILGNALKRRLDDGEVDTDLDEATTALRLAVEATPAGEGDHGTRLESLGQLLERKFRHSADPSHLNEAVDRLRASVAATAESDPARSSRLLGLADLLRQRFDRDGDLVDLDGMIEAYGQASANCAPATRRPVLALLGSVLHNRYDLADDADDLDASIRAFRASLDPGDDSPEIDGGAHALLGAALNARFVLTGRRDDVDDAIDVLQAGVDLLKPGDSRRANRLRELSNALRQRFEVAGTSSDADRAVDAARAALACAGDQPRPGLLNSLGGALRARFGRKRDPADLDAAIQTFEDMIGQVAPDSGERAGFLSNLANALSDRFQLTDSAADLDSAIDCATEAAHTIWFGDRLGRCVVLTNLGGLFAKKAARTDDITGWDAAVDTLRAAASVISPEHPQAGKTLANLGSVFAQRYRVNGDDADLADALSAFSAAAGNESAAPLTRIRAAKEAAEVAGADRPAEAAELLVVALGLVPRLIARQLPRSDQQAVLRSIGSLATEAAAVTLMNPRVDAAVRARRALELLEGGRATILAQALDIRGDLSDLRWRRPDLAERFEHLSVELSRDVIDTDERSPDAAPSASPSWRVGDRRRHQAELLAELETEIRRLDGFDTFARAPSAEHLRLDAEGGDVVTFNVSPHRSDALIVTSGGVTHVPLPAMPLKQLAGRINAFHRALAVLRSPDGQDSFLAQQAVVTDTLEWLWDVAAAPVLSALGHTTRKDSGDPWPRVWWVPGGLLGLLPIHAAGHHRDRSGRTVLDRVISSYTPTIRALRYSRAQDRRPSTGPGESLIVAMPTTPGLPHLGPLKNVRREVAMLQRRLPRPVLLSNDDGQAVGAGDVSAVRPTRRTVIDHLSGAAIAHFACHGTTDPSDPSKSRLLLADHQDEPLDVASLASVYLDRARLAYLSACSTAITADTELLDEAIHLTSAFQLAGFAHVIGTLWELDDAIAVSIADQFYRHLGGDDGEVDTSLSPYALHHAVRAAREHLLSSPSLWAGFMHAGA